MNLNCKISVVISAYNEETQVEECLKSARFADEIIFIDNSSTDITYEIAKKYTSKIFIRPNNKMLNVNKNFGFSKAKNDWILSLDADERITKELSEEIKDVIAQPKENVNGYWIPRKNIIFGKWIQHSIWFPDYQLRLFKKGKGAFPQKHVHEYLEVEGKSQKLDNHLEHINYSTVSQYIKKMDQIYTESEVEHFLSSQKSIHWIDALRFPLEDFLKTFFAKKGYKDGLHGLVLSILQAFYAEIVFIKIWEKQGFKEYNSQNFLSEVEQEFEKTRKKFSYWFATATIDETKSPLGKLSHKIRRKLSSI